MPRVVVLTGKAIREYFEGALAEVGASLATWVVLYGMERGGWGNQRNLARDLRIEGATLTRHLDRMERDGLIVRTRDPDDRRQMQVDLTPEGHEMFHRLKSVAAADREPRDDRRVGGRSSTPAADPRSDPGQRGR